MDVEGWLRQLGLDQYGDAFRENAIDGDVLPKLTAEDLKDLGVVSVGHRRKLLAAIAEAFTSQALLATIAQVDVAPHPIDTAERRQLSVMFCDLVGSTALSAKLDPEDMREVIGAYHRCCASLIEQHGGFAAKYMGDGVLAYFGYPIAHEHDAERAVEAALSIVAAAPKLVIAAGAPLQVRVGIATGIVVVGDLLGSGESQERGIVGETPNLAARLQGIAEPGGVIVADGTRRLIGNLFALKDLGAQDLKGIASRTRAWAALRANTEVSRFDALHASGLSPLVGREEECDLMLRRWAKAKTGDGQVVLLSGEAGVGKSRLTAAFLERLTSETHIRLRYFCSPQHADSAFFPLIGQLERAAGFAHDDDVKTKLDKLDALLERTATSSEDAAVIADLLSLPNDGRYPALVLTPVQRRQRTMEALRAQIDALASKTPVLMIFEDAHWADPSSLELFGRLVGRIESVLVLLFITFRPEFAPPWVGRPNVTALTINRLTQTEVVTLIDRVVGKKVLAASVRRDIVERADGVPLFVEEITKAVLEAQGEGAELVVAASPNATTAVPATLHASLMARLDRLGDVKAVAQIGAAIGREFSHELVAAVFLGTGAELSIALDRLVDAGLVFRQGTGELATYLFKHALVQDAAWGTLLREPRRALHARIVDAIEALSPGIAGSRPETLARHCDEAGLSERAAALWGQAGQQSLDRSALLEAERQLSRALTLITLLPGTPSLRREHVRLQVNLANTLMHTRGYASSATKTALREATALIEQSTSLGEPLDDPLAPFAILYGSFSINFNSFDGKALSDIAARYFALAEQLRVRPMIMMGFRLLGVASLYTGYPQQALDYFDSGFMLYDTDDRSSLATLFNMDVATTFFGWRSQALWLLGFPDAAQADARRALAEARSANHVATTAFTLFTATLTYFLCGDYKEVQANAEALTPLTELASAWKYVDEVFQLMAADGIEKKSQALEFVPTWTKIKARGQWYWRPLISSLLSLSFAKLGLHDDARQHSEEALSAIQESGECWFAADVHRTAGEIVLLSKSNSKLAQSYFEQALQIARSQKARSLELRAAMSLARLYRDEGLYTEAYELLAPTYAWFTEGFQTRDLKDAKSLLDELS